jgi:hypothetical protein
MALRIFVLKRTLFLFHLSTSTPAKIPKINDGRVKEITTPETALFEFAILKTTIRSAKLKRFMENLEKNSEAIRNKNGLIRRALKI